MRYITEAAKITLLDEKYWILSSELNNYNIEELNDILLDIENVFNEEYHESSFSNNVAVVSFTKEKSKIEYYGDFVGEESTNDIYEMIKNYRDARLAYDKKKAQ
ncbi:MAG TPA: hypothetical protein VIM75_16250 [Ohtaekwangia sp.]|uniref:hypothetical protein n=1 Tax=Ohtaekwangia sp. TaxID=2066019 RepID=UPI002F95FB79